MSLRRKNLLEAFKQSDASSAPARPPSREASAVPPSPLLAGPATPARAPAQRGREAMWALSAIGLVVAFVLGFVLGRNTRGEARAEEPVPTGDADRSRPTNQPRSFQERPPANPGANAAPVAGTTPPPDAEARIQDSPLFDPANLYTVVVASYTKSNQDLAWATHQHLKDAKLPVFPPVESRNLVVVLAGAAPTSAELEKVEASVKALARDGQKKDYSDAYRARIDTLIPREKKGTSKP